MTMTDLFPPSSVAFARAGELLVIDGAPFVLWSACDAPAPTHCLTCLQPLANQGQLEMHIETGTHRFAARCAVHGWEAMR